MESLIFYWCWVTRHRERRAGQATAIAICIWLLYELQVRERTEAFISGRLDRDRMRYQTGSSGSMGTYAFKSQPVYIWMSVRVGSLGGFLGGRRHLEKEKSGEQKVDRCIFHCSSHTHENPFLTLLPC